MSDVKPFHGLAKMEDQHADIFPGSPLAMITIFVETIRARFRGDNEVGLPWVWHADPTPDENETNEPGAPRTIYIESQYTEAADARNFRPAILVEKEDTQLMKLWIGNCGDIHVPSRLQVYVAHALIPITILCLSNRRGESANLGDYVWMHMAASRDIIRSTFNIHDIQPPVLGKTVPQRRSGNENETWSTPVTMVCQIKFMWRTKPIAPLLQEAVLNIQKAGGGDFDIGATQLALYSKRTR